MRMVIIMLTAQIYSDHRLLRFLILKVYTREMKQIWIGKGVIVFGSIPQIS